MESLPHSRVVPSAKHTLDDLVFAAFQAPVLSLSAHVLFHHRTFTALLLLRTVWRTERRLSQADVGTALLGARCCRPDTLADVDCPTCRGVLSVSPNPKEQERLRREGEPIFTAQWPHIDLLMLRPRCTSSRKHVGSVMLVLAAQIVPGVVIVSDSFAIYARHAARHMQRIPQGDEVDRRLVASSLPSRGTPLSQMEECWFISPRDASPAGVALVDPDQCLRKPGPRGMAIRVAVISAIGLTEEENQLMASGIVPVLRANVPGYLVHKSSVHPTVVIVVLGFQHAGDFAIADGLAWRYSCNEIRNPLSRNLINDGLVRPLLLSTNMD
eukprot:m51a1_g1381 hypothetical protein (327) ;mRNA; f:450709-451756